MLTYLLSNPICSFIRKRPAVCIDVDGVLKLGHKIVPGASNGIQRLRDHNIPLAILTNGGGETEIARSEKLTSLLNLTSKYSLKPCEIILCHTPMKDALKKYNKDNSIMLILGVGDIKEVMQSYGYSNYITSDEYALLYPQVLPFFYFYTETPSKEIIEKTRKEVEKRINRPIKGFLKIDAICQMTDVIKWDMNTQILSDLLISPNGIPGSIRLLNQPQKVDYHLACRDLLFQDSFPIPRFACGSFFYCLEKLFKLKYKRPINFVDYGKPSKIIYDYARNSIVKNYPREYGKFYMIGDNPEVDIKGANDSGFHSILVRTGIFKGINSKDYPAKTVVNSIKEAIDFILNEEIRKI